MTIGRMRYADGANDDQGGRWSVSLTLPVFENERIERFYDTLRETLRELAERRRCTVIVEHQVTHRDKEGYSLYLDFLWYQGRELLSCYRVSDTRRWDGVAIPPPKHLRKAVPRDGGWYRAGDRFVSYRNVYSPEQGSGVRRSAYRSFLPEESLPWQK